MGRVAAVGRGSMRARSIPQAASQHNNDEHDGAPQSTHPSIHRSTDCLLHAPTQTRHAPPPASIAQQPRPSTSCTPNNAPFDADDAAERANNQQRGGNNSEGGLPVICVCVCVGAWRCESAGWGLLWCGQGSMMSGAVSLSLLQRRCHTRRTQKRGEQPRPAIRQPLPLNGSPANRHKRACLRPRPVPDR